MRAIIRAAGNEQFTEAVVHYYRHGAGAAPGRPRYAQAQDRLDEWPRVDAPVSFLYGVDDGREIAAAGRGNANMFTQAYDRSELPGAGHFLPRERPDAVAAAIRLRLQQPAGLPVDLAHGRHKTHRGRSPGQRSRPDQTLVTYSPATPLKSGR